MIKNVVVLYLSVVCISVCLSPLRVRQASVRFHAAVGVSRAAGGLGFGESQYKAA